MHFAHVENSRVSYQNRKGLELAMPLVENPQRAGRISPLDPSGLRLTRARKREPVERIAYNVMEFCEAVGISRAFFYKLPTEDRPEMTQRGGRWLISVEVAKAWVRSAPRPVSSTCERTPPG
jgi:hypothetical protein